MGFVQKYDIKIGERNTLRGKIEAHIDDVFQTLEVQTLLSAGGVFESNVKYLLHALSFLNNVDVISSRDMERYVEKIKDLQKEHIYLQL